MNLRPYQTRVVAAIESGWADVSRQLAVVPNGGGKTIIFSHLAARRQPERTLILCHREELIDQAMAKLKAATGLVAEKEKAESYASLGAGIVVASVQTMVRRVHRWPLDHFGLVICDEAHHALSDSWQGVLKHFDGHADVLGVTATPDRGDKRDLGIYFQKVACEVGLFDLIREGYLSRIAVKSVPLEIDLNRVRTVAGDFSDADLGDALVPYLGKIAEAIREHASFRKVLAFLPLIATSRKFVAECEAVGLSAAHVDGESEDRAEILRRYAAGEFDVLSNAMLLTEGFDDPSIDCVVVLRPTRSRSLFAQMVGRGTRVERHKENLLLLDFLWMHARLSVVHPAALAVKSEEEAAVVMDMARKPGGDGKPEAADLEELVVEAAHAREEALRKRLVEMRRREATSISAEEFALRHKDLALAEYEPATEWERTKLSDKQAACLVRAGIDLATVRGRGHASALLDVVFRGKNVRLASEGQRRVLARMRWRSPDGIRGASEATAGDFFRVMGELAKKRKAKKMKEVCCE